MNVAFYTRKNCGLCDTAYAVVAPIVEEYGLILKVIDVDSKPALAERFGGHVPVVEVGANIVATYRVDSDELRAALDRGLAEERA